MCKAFYMANKLNYRVQVRRSKNLKVQIRFGLKNLKLVNSTYLLVHIASYRRIFFKNTYRGVPRNLKGGRNLESSIFRPKSSEEQK